MGLLDGKVVLVTGGGRGIGREVALISARQGAKVVVNDLGGGIHGEGADKGPAEEVVAEIRAAGGEAVSNTESVTDLAAVNRMVQQCMDTFGGLHIVQNPAGFLRDRMIHNMTEEEWDGIIEVHLRGHFNVVRATINHFRGQKEGNYVMWSSTSGLIGNVGQTNYGAAKMGIAGLSRIIALEGASKNVRSNVIAPVAFTRLIATIPVKDEAGAARMEAMKQTLRPEQPARLAVALAASKVTGQIFGARSETIELYSQPRPIQTIDANGEWTVDSLLNSAFPAMEAKFTPLGRG